MNYKKILEEVLFPVEEQKKEIDENVELELTKTYVVIDAARIKQLTNELMVATNLKYENLFLEEDAIKFEEAAPYLIELKKNDDFTQWVYANVYGKQGAIFLHARCQIEVLAQELRPHINVTITVPHPKKPKETMVAKAYVRLYDPRVFVSFLDYLEEKETFFSKIDAIYVEDKFYAETLLCFNAQKQSSIDLSKGIA